jgi:hypothetical protein
MRLRSRTWVVLVGLAFPAVLLSSCSGDPNRRADAGTDPDTGADAGADAGIDTGTDGGTDGACDEPTPADQAALDVAVHAYLTGADDTLLDTYSAVYGHLCFDAVAHAIRSWPLTGDTPA